MKKDKGLGKERSVLYEDSRRETPVCSNFKKWS